MHACTASMASSLESAACSPPMARRMRWRMLANGNMPWSSVVEAAAAGPAVSALSVEPQADM